MRSMRNGEVSMPRDKVILFVHDDPAEVMLCEMILHRERQDRVIHVSCLPEAVQSAITEHVPNVIFLGHGKSDRMSLYQAIRSFNNGRNIPVVFWRTDRFATRLQEAVSLGISGSIPVVYQPNEIIAARDAVIAGGNYFPRGNQKKEDAR
jgi:DNA-binding NarL/FixJ family response regulator